MTGKNSIVSFLKVCTATLDRFVMEITCFGTSEKRVFYNSFYRLSNKGIAAIKIVPDAISICIHGVLFRIAKRKLRFFGTFSGTASDIIVANLMMEIQEIHFMKSLSFCDAEAQMMSQQVL